MEKELKVKEQEKLYVEMKQILSRMPGPETQQQVLIYQQALKKKNKELKVGRETCIWSCFVTK